jgi:hypothetical protein
MVTGKRLVVIRAKTWRDTRMKINVTKNYILRTLAGWTILMTGGLLVLSSVIKEGYFGVGVVVGIVYGWAWEEISNEAKR